MACGERGKLSKWSLTICHADVPYPCGLRWCRWEFQYPCGLRWCRKWGVTYPCGVRWCSGSVTYLCGIVWCTFRVPYPCLKKTLVDAWCYDFSSIGKTCYLVGEVHYGCCEGREYRWTDWCLGAGYGNTGVSPIVGGSEGRHRVCLEDPPKEIGPCSEGKSIPRGGEAPGGYLDPGSVTPQPGAGGTLGASSVRYSKVGTPVGSKLGRCTRCIRLSLAATAVSWISLWIVKTQDLDILAALLLLPATGFTLLGLVHIGALVRRGIRAARRSRAEDGSDPYRKTARSAR